MTTKRKAILWTAAAVLVVSVCALPFMGGDTRPTLNLTGDELMRILQGDFAKYPGPRRLPLGQAIKNPAYLKMRGRLFLGAKLKSLVTTNAPLHDLATVLAYDSDGPTVIVRGDRWWPNAPKFGKFDSGDYSSRSSEARAIRKTLEDAGWRVEFLTDGKVAILSTNDYELLLTAKSPARQRELLQQFEKLEGIPKRFQQPEGKALAHLWHVNYLDEQIKLEIVKKNYRLSLRQLPSGGWEVRANRRFPFPAVETEFTPTLYCNGEIKWSPGRPQYAATMDKAGANGPAYSPITSMSGGEFKNGDVLQYRIDLAQKVDGHSWNITLWTDKLVLKELKR